MPAIRTLFAAGAVLAALAVLVGLGTWQMLRRAEKHQLIARIAAQTAAPPIFLPVDVADPATLDYRRVTVTGRFLHAREMHLLNRVRDGVAGVHVITPLVRDDGPTVLVDRGWAPASRPADDSRLVGRPSGRQTITGIARVPAAPGAFTPPNEPARGLWFSLDIGRMASAQGGAPVAPLVVVSDMAPGERWPYPAGAPPRIDLRDDHLQYALTWYSLAVVLVVVVVIARRRKTSSRP
jgi:surfeit locus 1 family protein